MPRHLPQSRSQFRSAVGLAICLLAGGVLAQRPLVTVGGLNPDFLDLPQAVAAALPDSVILVRPGTYTGFTTNKPLRITLDFTATTGSVQPAPGSAYAISVNGLPSGAEFILLGRGATVAPGIVGAIRVANTVGSVIVEGITVLSGTTRSALEVQNTSTVVVQRCSLAGTPALQASWTSLALNESVCTSPGGVGAVGYNSLLDFVRTSFSGYRLPGLRVYDCNVRLASNGSSSIGVTGNPVLPVSAFEALNSIAQWDQNTFVMNPAAGAPAFANFGALVLANEVPVLVTSSAPLGGTATMRMTISGTPLPGLVAMGRLAQPPSVIGITGIYLNTLLVPTILTLGIVDQTGQFLQVNVPNNPVLRGEVFCLQGVTMLPSGLPVLSGPGLWTLL